jgi:hypothetical protein
MSWEPGEPLPMPPTPRPTLPTPWGLLVGFSWKLSKEWHGRRWAWSTSLLAFGGLYHRNKELHKFLSLSSNAVFVQYMLLVWSMWWVYASILYNWNVGAPPPPPAPLHRPPHPFSLSQEVHKNLWRNFGIASLLQTRFFSLQKEA